MGYRHDREQVLDRAVSLAGDRGLSELTFRSVAQLMGIPDRTVVYYFPSKAELVAAVLARTGESLQDLLAAALGERLRTPDDIVRISWTALRAPDADPHIRLLAECLGLAVRGREPYRSMIAEVTISWTGWFAARIEARATTNVGESAAGIVATLDGLLLMHVTVGARSAEAAARGLGLSE